MIKQVTPVAFLFLFSCSSDPKTESALNMQPPAPIQNNSEVYANYRNMSILFNEEKSGNESYYTQEIAQQKEDVVFRMRKIPTALYLKKDNPGMDDSTLQATLKELENEQVFYFEIEEALREDLMKKYHEADYDQAVSYISFDIQNDLSILTADGDTIKPSFTIYERNFHLAPFERIIIDFNGLKQGEAFELVYNDKMFGKGPMIFQFPDQKFVENNIKELL